MSESLRQFETGNIASADKVSEMLPILDVHGGFKFVEGKDAIIVRVRNLLLTPLGTYPFDPNYGSLLHKQLFEFSDNITERAIYYEVNTRINNYIDGVSVDSVELTWSESKKTCRVDVFLNVLDDVNKTPLSLMIQNYGNSMYGSIDDPVFEDFKF